MSDLKVPVRLSRPCPGKVVFKTSHAVVQYEPSSETVHRRPLLIVPPWIKTFTSGLKPQNSFIKWCVEQVTVFVISRQSRFRTADRAFRYLVGDRWRPSMRSNRPRTKPRSTHWLARRHAGPARWLTWQRNDWRTRLRPCSRHLIFPMSDISVFIDDDQLKLVDEHMQRLGHLEGQTKVQSDARERVIWFVLNNHSVTNAAPFDLLYWNSDRHACRRRW